ncbi:MAG: hypothetical protein J6M62_10425 [Selenomonadaceae bacterium]|nr:hypothetical protein [Selenomonadaceae bacterium]
MSTTTGMPIVIILLIPAFSSRSDLNDARSSSRKTNAKQQIKEQMTFGVSRK